jgi:hypothetical protein
MKKLALVLASVAGLGFVTPSIAMENSAPQARIQLAQADFSVRIGEPRRHRHVREKVIVREGRGHHHHRHWRGHDSRAESVTIVKRRPAVKKKVIIRD